MTGCHSTVINPIGFAFEHYDAVGRYRTTDNGQPVDASGTYVLDGEARSFKDAVELGRHVAESNVAHACYARHLLEFLHGRAPAGGDEALVQAVARRSRDSRAAVKSLAIDLVTSDEFLTRVP